MVACGHSTPSPQESQPAGTAEPLSAVTGCAAVPPEPTNKASGAATSGGGPIIGDGHGDERHDIRPVDARIIAVMPSGTKLKLGIGLPREIESGTVTRYWTGAFTKDGRVIDGTDFKLNDAGGHLVNAEIIATKVPSETVRLLPPGYVR